MENTCTFDQLACAYLDEIISLHWVPGSVVFDQDMKFQEGFGRNCKRYLGPS